MRKYLQKSRKGLSIIELLLYLGILSIFLGVLTQIIHSSLDVQLESEGSSSVDLANIYLISRLQYDVHRATAITSPATSGVAGTALSLTVDGITYTYQVANSQLTLTNDLGVNRLTDATVAISDFSVTRLGTNAPTETVRISYTLTSASTTTSGQPQTRSTLFTIGTR